MMRGQTKHLGASLTAALLAASLCNPASATDCWVKPVQTIARNAAAPEVAIVQRVEQILRADAGLNRLGDVRLQLGSSTDIPRHTGAPRSAVVRASAHRSPVWTSGCGLDQRKADYVSPFNVAVHINSLQSLVHLLASPDEERENGHFYLPQQTGSAGGQPIFGKRVMLITPDGVPALVPLTVKEHLDSWERQLTEMQGGAQVPQIAAQLRGLRAHRSGLTPAQLSAPVALGGIDAGDNNMWSYSLTSDANAIPRVRFNPALWRQSNAQSVRAIAVEVWINNEDDALKEAMETWLARFDPAPLKALLKP